MSKHQCPQGYVEVADIKGIQKLLLKFMVKFHDVCEKHHLIYNMCGGTLLGAVRHKGFIPWDDDIDVCMPRDDYERFIQIVQSEYSDDIILELPFSKGYVGPYLKIGMPDTILYEKRFNDRYGKRNLYIDVFPVDGYAELPEHEKKIFFDKLNILSRKMMWAGYKICPEEESWLRRLLWVPKFFVFNYYHLQGPYKHVRQFLELTQKFRFEECDMVNFYWGYWGRTWLAKDKFLDRTLYDFEGYKFWSVRDYDDWLARIYGDYMTPPPLEKRVNTHGFELFVKKEILESL